MILTNTRLRFVKVFGKEQFLIPMNWKLKSAVVSLVSVEGMDALAKKLDWRSSETRLDANSRPSRLKILRLLAFRLVSVSRSCWVSGPVGLCKVSRIAASSPPSAMTTSCARAEAVRKGNKIVARTEKVVRFFIRFV